MALKIQISDCEFTPSEAGAISGVSVDLQRDWRRRGFLPKSERHARFTFMQLAELRVMSLLASVGIGPKRTFKVAPTAAFRVLAHALKWKDAWDGDIDLIPGKNWAEKHEALSPRGELHRFFVWASEGPIFTNSVDTFANGFPSSDSRTQTHLIVLDLAALAGGLLDRINQAHRNRHGR